MRTQTIVVSVEPSGGSAQRIKFFPTTTLLRLVLVLMFMPLILPVVRFRERSGKATRGKNWKVSTWEMLYKEPAEEVGPMTSLLPTRSDAAATHTWGARTTRTLKAKVLGEARTAAATTKILNPSSSCRGSGRVVDHVADVVSCSY